jgi:hypothetical protein
VNKLKDEPFALIGVNTNSSDPRKLKAVMEKEKLNWRSFGSREVTDKWNASTPGYYVLDHHGVIRHKWMGNAGPGEKAIDTALEKLIHEVKETRGSEKTPEAVDRPQPLPMEIVDAWKAAGAKVGWLRTSQLGFRSRQFVFHELMRSNPPLLATFRHFAWCAGKRDS